MKRLALIVALLLCLSSPVFAATAWNTSSLAKYQVANLPRSPSSGTMFYVLDGSSTSDCTTGGGTNKVVCIFNGSTYTAIGSGGSGTPAGATGSIQYNNAGSFGGISTVANGILSCNSSNVCSFYTNISLDNTAPQIYDSADSTKYIWLDPSQMTSGKKFKLQLSAATDVTVNLTADASNVNFNGLGFISTGMISGGIPMFFPGTTYTIGTNGSSESYGALIMLSAASNLLGLPSVPRVGMSGCVTTSLGSQSTSPGAIKLMPDPTSWIITSAGSAKSAGSRLTSSGATSDYACFIVTAPSVFRIFGAAGTWN